EGRQIDLVQVLFAGRNVEVVPQRLRSAVDGVMFRASRRQQVVGMAALQSADEGDAESRREKRVLAIGFLAAAPARIAKDVDVRRPKGEAAKDLSLERSADVAVELRPPLNAGHVRDLLLQFLIPHRGEADRLR